MNLRVRRCCVIADFRNIHRVEHIVAAAVVTVHVNLALFLDHQLDMAAVSYWIGLDVGVAASAVFMAIRLFTLESGFMENTAAVSLRGRLSLEPAYDNGVYRVKAEVLTGIKIIWQYCREIGNNLFVPPEKIVEIRGHVLTGIQRKLIGHAARAYVP